MVPLISSLIVSLVTTSGITVLLYLSGFFFFLTPLPLAFFAARRGFKLGLLAFVITLLELTLAYHLPDRVKLYFPLGQFQPILSTEHITSYSVLYLSYFGFLGLGLTYAVQRVSTLEKGVIVALTTAFLGPIFLFTIWEKGQFVELYQNISKIFQFTLDQVMLLQTKAGLSADDIQTLKERLPDLMRAFFLFLPAMAINTTLGIIGLNLMFLRRIQILSLEKWPILPLWKLNDHAIWAPIGSGILFFINMYYFKIEGLEAIVLNLLIICAMLYFLQGLGIALFYLRGTPPFLRLSLYVLLALSLQFVGLFMIILGLFDFWFDFRKLKKVVG